MYNYPYQDPTRPIRERVQDLKERMSLSEKVGQVNQHLYGWECYRKDSGSEDIQLTDTFKQHVKWGGGIGALYGLFRADPWSKVTFSNGIPAKDSWRLTNKVQEYIIQHSRWGIPALIVEECPHGHQGLESTSYPTNIGRGNTFNTALLKKTSQLMAKELAAKGVHLALVSTLDLCKDPRWGRSEECFGEDPILAARMSEAVISGFQGNLISETIRFLDQTTEEINKHPHQIGVVLKHCIAQGEALGGHNSGTVTIGPREFSDIYGPLLKSTRNAVGVMAAYNDIDGVPCHINQTLFKQQLREQNGYQGLVMADGIALDRLNDVFPTPNEAAAQALEAGIDLSLWDDTYTTIEEGVLSQIIDEAALDQAVEHVLAIKFLLGLFEHPYVDDPCAAWDELMAESQQLNRQIAEESLTLVKNNGILPLANTPRRLAVIGPNADQLYNLLGDYSAPQKGPILQNTVYQAIQSHYTQSEVVYAQGCEVRNQENQEAKIQEALHTAKGADVIIAVLGGSSARNFDMTFLQNGAVSSKGINMDSGENVDVASLSLGGRQQELLQQLSQLGKPIISILIQGRPYDLTLVQQVSDAVLIAWFPGQEGAQAIANTLSGDNNPSGRLSVSYPRNAQQLPVYYYQRAASKQDDYYDLSGSPLLPFGLGLSYTHFAYRDLQVTPAIDNVTISVKVKNTGSCSGKISTLLFVKLFGGSVIQRTKLLKAFDKDLLQPQEEKTVTFRLEPQDFTYMDVDFTCRYAKYAEIMVDQLTDKMDCIW